MGRVQLPAAANPTSTEAVETPSYDYKPYCQDDRKFMTDHKGTDVRGRPNAGDNSDGVVSCRSMRV